MATIGGVTRGALMAGGLCAVAAITFGPPGITAAIGHGMANAASAGATLTADGAGWLHNALA